MPREGFVRRTIAQRTAYAIQSRTSNFAVNSRVAQRIAVARNAEREVSQIHSKGSMTPAGQSAQSQAESAARVRPPMRRAAKKRGIVAAAEKMQLRRAAARKDANVNWPKMRKIAARMEG